MIEYVSTRGAEPVDALTAIRRGLAPDGGLYVPTELPPVDLAALVELPYPELAAAVIGPFVPQLGRDELLAMLHAAYARFDTPAVAPLAPRGHLSFLQLWHGPTSAFKDMALTVLPHLLTAARAHGGAKGRSLVLTATSGDTGKAALAGFAGVPGTEVVVLYPTEGVSHVQRLQMVTQPGANVHVIGIEGTFDDAQRAVKTLLADPDFAAAVALRHDELTSANSINLGRLLPQVAYYVWGYLRMVENGVVRDWDPVDVVVPTGNFGNILAASYARTMGVPFVRVICAANENRVLADFFDSGIYDARRELVRTSSPSMDILVSSNLERFLYHQGGRDRVVAAMADLADSGRFEWMGLPDWLVAGSATEQEMADAIRHLWDADYLVDPHTAVAAAVVEKLGVERQTLVAETASAYKFAPAVLAALGHDVPDDGFAALDALADLAAEDAPPALSALRDEPVRHDRVVPAPEITAAVREVLGA